MKTMESAAVKTLTRNAFLTPQKKAVRITASRKIRYTGELKPLKYKTSKDRPVRIKSTGINMSQVLYGLPPLLFNRNLKI